MVKLKRVYEPRGRGDGARILVERLWPRGLKKVDAHLTEWMRDIAPSPALRRWYAHEPAKWPEFRRRYRAELRAPQRRRLLRALADRARGATVTLMFAARDTERNSAAVVCEELRQLIER